MQRLLVLGLLIATTVGLAGNAQAFELSGGDQTSLSSGRTTDGSYYTAGNTVVIDGNIKGDVFCAGQTVTINGPVSGDVICAAAYITINGDVSGSVRIVGQAVTLNGKIGRNVSVISQTLVTSKESTVAGELMAQVGNITLDGTISGESYGNADQLTINGGIAGKVRYAAQVVTIGSAAKLGAGLEYTSNQKADVKSGAQITGGTKQNLSEVVKKQNQFQASQFLAGLAFTILSTLIVGALIIWLAPRFVARASERSVRPGFTLFMGFAALVLTPIAAVMIMVTIIGIPVGILGLVIWGVALYLSRIVAALALGTFLFNRLNKSNRSFRPYAAGAIGIVVATLVFALPYIGGFVSFLAVLFGLGVVGQAIRDHIDRDEKPTTVPLPLN